MSGDDAQNASIEEECSALYVCDLASCILEEELRELFGQYGDMTCFEQVYDLSEDAVFVQYAKADVAQEVQSTMNYASLRHKTCRCLPLNALNTIRQTMHEGHRLVVENLDLNVQSQGLRDLFSLFGPILDCKVEVDEDEQSRGYGFVHFDAAADASKALTFLDGMQIGDSTITVRQSVEKDSAIFTGCFYASPDSLGKQDRDSAKDLLRSLQAHHLEIYEDLKAKLDRLKVLAQLYTPGPEQQMIVIASPTHMQAVSEVMDDLCEDGSFNAVSFASTADARDRAVEAFASGYIHVLLLSSDVATRQDFELSKSAAVLVNFDFPSSLRVYLHRISKRADGSSRVHSFFTPDADKQLTVPLMAEMEEAGHEIPPALVDFWTSMESQSDD